MFKCYDFYCESCDHKTEHVVDTREPDWETTQECELCGKKEAYRVMSAPAIRTADNAVSYLDGTKREGFEDLKKAAKLEVAKSSLPWYSAERKAMEAEIKERKKVRK